MVASCDHSSSLYTHVCIEGGESPLDIGTSDYDWYISETYTKGRMLWLHRDGRVKRWKRDLRDRIARAKRIRDAGYDDTEAYEG